MDSQGQGYTLTELANTTSLGEYGLCNEIHRTNFSSPHSKRNITLSWEKFLGAMLMLRGNFPLPMFSLIAL